MSMGESEVKVLSMPSSVSARRIANLQETPIFAQHVQHVFPILQQFMTYRKAESAKYLWEEGDTSDFLAIILKGKLEALKETELPNHPFLTGIFCAGSVIGEDGFIDNRPRNTSVRVIASSDLLIISRSSFEQLEQNYPAIANLILKWLLDLVSIRLRHTQKRLAAIF